MNLVKDDPNSPAVRQRLLGAWALIFNSIAVALCLTMAGASPVPSAMENPKSIRAGVKNPLVSKAVAPVGGTGRDTGGDTLAGLRQPLPPPSPEPVELLREIVPCAPVAHVVWMEVTAYCPCTKCCGPNAQGMTASGRDISYNGGAFVAADTDLFAFNTRVSIPGYNGSQPVEVIDRGSAIKGNHLDVFFPTHDQAVQWGRRRLPITISQ